MLHLWKFVGSIFPLRVRWSPGQDNPAKGFIQIPGTNIVDNLARLVGAGKNKAEWWTRPFTLSNWGEANFIARLQGWSTAKRQRSTIQLRGCIAQRTSEIHQLSRDAANLVALHAPNRLSSEGHPLTTLGNITRIVGGKMLRNMGKIGRHFPSKFLQQILCEF